MKPTPITVLAEVYTDLPDRRAADALSAHRNPYIEAVKAALGVDEPRFRVGDTVIVDSPHTRGIPGAERARANFRGFHGEDKAVVVFDDGGFQSVVDAAWLEPVGRTQTWSDHDAEMAHLHQRYVDAWNEIRGTWVESYMKGWPDPTMGDSWRLDFGKREMVEAVDAAEAQAREVRAYTPAPDRAKRHARRNPAIPAVDGYDGAALTPGHADTRAARQARARFNRADTGTPLGAGNFGSATLVRDPDGTPWVVKQPVRVDRHGKAYTPERAKAYLLHEAGIANRVEATGNRVVPHTVFVDGPGWDFGLVREYGEVVDPATLTLDEIRKLEQDLLAVEAGGVQVDDDLLILRRPDGSLFIGDVGWWRVLDKPWGTGFASPNTKIPHLLGRALEDHPDSRVKAALGWGEYAHVTPDLLDSRADLAARFNADKPGFTTHLLRGPADAILARDAVGFPVRADVRRLVRDLARKMPSWDPEGDSLDHRNLGRVVLAGDSSGFDLPDPSDPYAVVPSD